MRGNEIERLARAATERVLEMRRKRMYAARPHNNELRSQLVAVKPSQFGGKNVRRRQ
jgi:hypothetical protein